LATLNNITRNQSQTKDSIGSVAIALAWNLRVNALQVIRYMGFVFDSCKLFNRILVQFASNAFLPIGFFFKSYSAYSIMASEFPPNEVQIIFRLFEAAENHFKQLSYLNSTDHHSWDRVSEEFLTVLQTARKVRIGACQSLPNLNKF
jgi:hypothetical protein